MASVVAGRAKIPAYLSPITLITRVFRAYQCAYFVPIRHLFHAITEHLAHVGVEPPVGLPVTLDVEEEHPTLAGLHRLSPADADAVQPPLPPPSQARFCSTMEDISRSPYLRAV